MTKFDYSMHLQFKFKIFHKIQRNKKKYFAECRPWHSATECQEVALGKEGIFTECRALALGKGPLCRVPGPALGKEFFF